MRGLKFVFGGALLGGLVALVLGLLLGNTDHANAVVEMAAYVVLGAVLAGSAGGVWHILTKGSGRLERAAPVATKPPNKGAAAMAMLATGLGSAVLTLTRLGSAPEGAQGFLIGGLIGGLVGTAVGAYMLLASKDKPPQA